VLWVLCSPAEALEETPGMGRIQDSAAFQHALRFVWEDLVSMIENVFLPGLLYDVMIQCDLCPNMNGFSKKHQIVTNDHGTRKKL
jgi:hypothetical protein